MDIVLFPSRAIVLQVGQWAVYWYGLLYVVAFGVAWWLLPRLQRYRGLALSVDAWWVVIALGAAGVVIGGRLGFAVFYNLAYFLEQPLALFSLRSGGMSFHGGFIGVAVALGVGARWLHISFWRLADITVIPVGLGLALGRLGNFINQELYGTATTLPWGIQIPGVTELRHPVQLYAAGAQVLIVIVAWQILRRSAQPGSVVVWFLLAYSVVRFSLEYVRVQEYAGVSVGIGSLTRGQLLTIPLFLLGGALAWYRHRFPESAPRQRSLETPRRT